ncbi:hypothetical protein, partial [Phocaeicola sp.]|uniref:hypothetical protein n=1 Tax=Phocaeicola sp. TaxID=2773926 RepID=UPI003AB80EC9
DVVGRSGCFCLNLSDNSVMRGRVHARRTLKGLVADLRQVRKYKELTVNVRWYEERANYSECISVGNLYWQIELGL